MIPRTKSINLLARVAHTSSPQLDPDFSRVDSESVQKYYSPIPRRLGLTCFSVETYEV